MSGFFGTVGRQSCVTDLFYGTDYNSHLGTRRAGMATFDAADGQFCRSIHNLEIPISGPSSNLISENSVATQASES